MSIDPAAQPPDPGSTHPAPERRPPWVGPVVGVLVVVALVIAGMQVWRFMRPAETAATRPAAPPTGAGRAMFTLSGTVSRTGKDGQKQIPKDVTVAVLQPMWTPEQQEEWEKRVNDTVARACKELGGEAPPAVTADPASVIRADQDMTRRRQAAKSATPWKHECATQFLALLKEKAIRAGSATAAADGSFSVTAPPPGGIPYIVHAKSADGDWIEKLRGRSGRLELNDSNVVPE